MSKENPEPSEKVAALLRERAGYEQRGLPDRVALVDAELEALGHKVKTERTGRVERAVNTPTERR